MYSSGENAREDLCLTWCVRNRNIERYLKVLKMRMNDRIQEVFKKYIERLDSHPNNLARFQNATAHRLDRLRKRAGIRPRWNCLQDLLDWLSTLNI